VIENNIFSCYIVGDSNLTLQCADIVLKQGHELLGLISSYKQIKDWCISNTIHHYENINEFQTKLHDRKFDFLFSIVNSEILSAEVLKLPSCHAINYHDSPLPKYAGLYATSHAILNGETQHAVTWHIMDEKIDTGSIIKQPTFPIETRDTAITLNLKCYEHAVSSFSELLKELTNNSIKPLKQNLQDRSYFGLKHKPKNLGFINWEDSAESIDRFCRAVTFGNYLNQLVTPKILINGYTYILKNHKTLDISKNSIPGKITHISDKSIHISTSTQDIEVLELVTFEGQKKSIQDLCESHAFQLDFELDKINLHLIEKLSKHPAFNPKNEQFWVKKFLLCKQEKISFLSKLEKKEPKPTRNPKRRVISSTLLNKLKLTYPKQTIEDVLLTAALIYFFKLNSYKNISIKYQNSQLRSELHTLLSEYIPFTTAFNSDLTFRDCLNVTLKEKKELFQNNTFCKDIFLRHPQLKNSPNEIDLAITFLHTDTPGQSTRKINLYISPDGDWFYFYHTVDLRGDSQSYAYFKKMDAQFLTLLKDITICPDKPIFNLNFIDSKETHNLNVAWNNTKYKYNYKKLLHEYFEAQVLKTPKSIAVTYEGKSITYNELNSKANKLANYLRDHGAKPNHLVGIALERSVEMVVCILGILKSGSAYLPLDPNYPEDRISYMLHDSQASLLLMDHKSIHNKPSSYFGKTIKINPILNENLLSTKNPEPLSLYSDLAYVIYTSGTTGNPKGVAVSHRSTCNHMIWMQKEYAFTAKDIFLQKTPFSFDASIWEFFIPLFIGAKLVIAPNDAHASPDQLIQLIIKNKISILQLVPTMLKELISTPAFNSCSTLKHIFSGGEALLPETIKLFFKKNPYNRMLHNLYGPTETTIQVVTATCSKKDAENNICRIGKPIFNSKMYILDSKMQMVPAGITGELYIGGDVLAVGYLNNPEFTNKKFLPNPFSKDPHDKLYKTGDLVKWLFNGQIEYLGRSDNQLKIRGFRIEINEIESHLIKIKAIHQCIVVPEPNLDDSMSLSAYLVIANNSKITAKDIRGFLNKKIPEYMIPNRFFVVDKLLTTPSGKIDRKILPTPNRRLDSGNKCIEPRNDVEKLLQHIWCLVLKIENIGINDDFFELGGNSILAMKILSLIQEQFSVSLSVRKLFQYTTIGNLSKEIENIRHESSDFFNLQNFPQSFVVPLKKSGNKTPLFLIHPIGGSVFWYHLLSKYLDEEQPLYALQDPGLDKNELIFNRLEEMASYYLEAIQLIQPSGPYFLGGASFGATVAIEIAKQLQEKGGVVDTIISLDGWAFYPALQSDKAYFKVIMEKQNSRILKKYIDSEIYNAEFLLKLQSHRENLLIQYKLPIIQSKLVLFKAEELNEIFKYNAPFNWWEEYSAQPIEFHLVPGDHESMFYEPHIKTLASKLNDSLNIKMASYLIDDLTENQINSSI